MPFEEVVRVLEMFGFEEARSRGSHHSFSDGDSLLVVPKVGGRAVKRTYLLEIAERLGLNQAATQAATQEGLNDTLLDSPEDESS